MKDVIYMQEIAEYLEKAFASISEILKTAKDKDEQAED